MLTDMELVALMPWENGQQSANFFPLEAATRGRVNAYIEDGVQFTLQVTVRLRRFGGSRRDFTWQPI